MRYLSTILYCLAGAVPLSAAPVNFKVATLIDARPESLERPRPYIMADARKICFVQPSFCELSSNSESLAIYLAKPGQSGQITVANSTFRTDFDFSTRVEDYLKAAEATLPADAKALEFKGSNDRVYVVNNFKSLTFEWSYTLYGRSTRRQVAFIDIDATHQLCVTVLSDEDTAPAAAAVAKRFMNSWFWADGIADLR